MRSEELEALRKLNIPTKRWGSSYRVKVKAHNTNRITYISNLSRPSNISAIAKYHKVNEIALRGYLKNGYEQERYKVYRNSALESHLFENINRDTFYFKMKELLNTQEKAFKVDVQLGYILIDTTSPNGEERKYSPDSNTRVFGGKPLAVNSKRDIDRIIEQIASTEAAEKVKYPSSAWKFKKIYAYKLIIYYRNHRLGDSEIKIPECIKKNQYILNFPKTDNKCMFYCIAYHLHNGPKKNPRTMLKIVKQRFREYCSFKSIDYNLDLFRTFEPIDIMQFDALEDCFKLNIDVFEMDERTIEVKKIRESEKEYENTINILDYKGHAMYITNLDTLLHKYPCNKCGMIFGDCYKLRNHKKNKCEHETIERFNKYPKMYKPCENSVQRLLRKYKVKGVDHYMDHFIVYDFEAILKTTGIQHGENTTFTNEHIPVSVSVSDSLTNQTRCFVNESPRKLLEEMFEYVDEVVSEIRDYNIDKFQVLADAILAENKRLRSNAPAHVVEVQKKVDQRYEEIKDMDLTERQKQKELNKISKQYPDYLGYVKQIEATDNDYKEIENTVNQVPLIGFNSGRYDINLIKKDLLDVLKVVNADDALVIKNPNYICISAHGIKMLDISNYLPAGTSLDSYLKTYVGECQCENKIQCTCGLGKEFFCYEYITSFDKLAETQLPPQSAFDSKMKRKKCTDEQYERIKFVWEHYQMKTIKDLLIWYNNNDVIPFVKAINNHRKLYKKDYELDIFMDGVSLPSLAEKIMYKVCYNNLESIKQQRGDPFEFPRHRYEGYKKQDVKANRQFALTLVHLNDLLCKFGYSCAFCRCALNEENVSADRIDNSQGHINGNITISCINCNVARKDMNMKAFRFKKKLEANKDNVIYSIDEENKDIYQKMKDNIVGGPSIIFNRYAKRNETYIRNGSKLVKKIIGYDANALYLWAIGNEMPCGRLTTIDAYDGIIEDIKNDKIFGFLECDIETPEHLKDYFGEMTPIFKNVEIDPDDVNVVGQHMYDYNQSRETGRAKKSKKLIGSYFGKQILIYTPLLKWYLEHGMVITKTYSFIKANSHRPFKKFTEIVSDARRAGNLDKSKKMVADMMKLVGNSAFGRSGMDKSKHKKVRYESDLKNVRAIVEHYNFHDLEELNGVYEVTEKKRSVKLNNPIHVSIAIYQLAKLRMLQFYYDCIDFYIDRSDFQYQETDTDSAYIAFSDEEPFKNLIKPELQSHFNEHKNEWFLSDVSKEANEYDKFTAGLFKEEWCGDAIVSLSSKNYICYLPDEKHEVKISAKGVQKSKNSELLQPTNFENVVMNQITLSATNSGLRLCKESKSVITYEQIKTGLN